jgi:hypothetical protein
MEKRAAREDRPLPIDAGLRTDPVLDRCYL